MGSSATEGHKKPIFDHVVPRSVGLLHISCGKSKAKDRPVTDHEGPEGRYRFSSTLSLTLAPDVVGGQRQAPVALPTRKTQYLLYRKEAGWAPGPVWTGAENLVPTGIRSPDRPASSESLYRLSYPGPHVSFGPITMSH